MGRERSSLLLATAATHLLADGLGGGLFGVATAAASSWRAAAACHLHARLLPCLISCSTVVSSERMIGRGRPSFLATTTTAATCCLAHGLVLVFSAATAPRPAQCLGGLLATASELHPSPLVAERFSHAPFAARKRPRAAWRSSAATAATCAAIACSEHSSLLLVFLASLLRPRTCVVARREVSEKRRALHIRAANEKVRPQFHAPGSVTWGENIIVHRCCIGARKTLLTT